MIYLHIFFPNGSLKRNLLHQTQSPFCRHGQITSVDTYHLKKVTDSSFFLAKFGGNIGEVNFKNFFSTFCIRTIFLQIFVLTVINSKRSLKSLLAETKRRVRQATNISQVFDNSFTVITLKSPWFLY